MKSKVIPFMAALAMEMARNPHFITARENAKKRHEQHIKEYAHTLFPVNLREYEFTIKGEKIMARNKKTAKMIYALRHKEGK